jgi:transcriptional regulator with XRE-family HTH domain
MGMPSDSEPTLTAKDLREKLGLSKGYASDLISGKRLPSLTLATRIRDQLGVPIERWVAPQ